VRQLAHAREATADERQQLEMAAVREERAAVRGPDRAADRRARAARAVGAVGARRRERRGDRPEVMEPLARRLARREQLARKEG